MKYVPNLIPEKSRVLKEYFKNNIHHSKKQKPAYKILRWIGGAFFILLALISLKHVILTFLMGIIAFMILPPGHDAIEKKFRFYFTTKINCVACLILFFISIPILSHYNEIDKREANLLKIKMQQEQKQKAEWQRKEKIRNDSLTFFIDASAKLVNEHKTEQARKQLNKASLFARLTVDKDKISIESNNISKIKAFDFISSGEYKKAIPLLDSLISSDGKNADFLYNRAICYSKVGKTQQAVSDCKMAIELGNPNAEKLYNKINPIKKRIAYYVTRCCDGSTSSSTGRGTCSHHGGVCNWSEPVYEEYRKYE